MRIISFFLLCVVAVSTQAKSLVLTTNSGLQIYYQASSTMPSRMDFHKDSFSINGERYGFQDVKFFRISSTDFTGAEGTQQGASPSSIGSIQADIFRLKGPLKLFNGQGSLLQQGTNQLDLSSLAPGTYVIQSATGNIKFTINQ